MHSSNKNAINIFIFKREISLAMRKYFCFKMYKMWCKNNISDSSILKHSEYRLGKDNSSIKPVWWTSVSRKRWEMAQNQRCLPGQPHPPSKEQQMAAVTMRACIRSCLVHLQSGHLSFLAPEASCCLLILYAWIYKKRKKMQKWCLNQLNKERGLRNGVS